MDMRSFLPVVSGGFQITLIETEKMPLSIVGPKKQVAYEIPPFDETLRHLAHRFGCLSLQITARRSAFQCSDLRIGGHKVVRQSISIVDPVVEWLA